MLHRYALLSVVVCAAALPCQEPWRVLPAGETSGDARLARVRTLNDAYHPWTPPTSRIGQEREARRLRERILVSTGLWPEPPRTPLEPVVHGKIERDDYTVEKVYFASLPGHYVTGSLYRPKGAHGRVPGVLCPHGHAHNGRMYDAGEEVAAEQRAKGAEQTAAGARFPLQACMVQLARMGCVVFHYDMVGYASSRQIGHGDGFADVESALRLQSTMGLQTWNSLRALDFLVSLPDVDAERIGVTGHSGGGTQTFILGAIDPRPTTAFPAVMVSTAMQGGCICENAPYLRIGCNNVAFAALFAPRPLAMSGANDWTLDIMTKGLPELQHVYGLHGAEDRVTAQCWPQFGHNYNQLAREMMYGWFNRHLGLGLAEPIHEREFEPVPPAELEVFDGAHPLPGDAGGATEVRAHWTETAQRQRSDLRPRDAAGVERYRRVIGAAGRVLLGEPARPGAVESRELGVETGDFRISKATIGRAGSGEQIPLVVVGDPASERTLLWVDGGGKRQLFDEAGNLIGPVRELVRAGAAVASIDVLGTGELTPLGPLGAPDRRYLGYTFGYNAPLLAQRVRDISTALAALPRATAIDLVGTGDAGVWVLLARALTPHFPGRTLVDLRGFGFAKIEAADDPDLLPGALKYGGLGGLAALAEPCRLELFGTEGVPLDELASLEAMSEVTGGELEVHVEPLRAEEVAARLLR